MILHSLTRGWLGVVDDEDADLITDFVLNQGTPRGYAMRRNDGAYRHRLILARKLGRALLPSEHVDHKRRQDAEYVVDDRRDNLRLSDKSKNSANIPKSQREGLTSSFKGVSRDTVNNKWRAVIYHNGKQMSLGRFVSETDAARAYDVKAGELFGEFARPNDLGVFTEINFWSLSGLFHTVEGE